MDLAAGAIPQSSAPAGTDSVTPNAAETRKRKASGPRKPRAPKRVAGVSDDGWLACEPKALKKTMKGYVKEIASMVNADWHDGWEEQGMEVGEWFMKFQPVIHAVHELSRAPAAPLGAYERANEAVHVLADSLRDMKAIPFREPLSEQFQGAYTLSVEWKEGDVQHRAEMSSPGEAVDWAWRVLLRSACGAGDRAPDEALLRYIRDAVDYCGADVLRRDNDYSKPPAQLPGGDAGRARLARLLDEGKYKELPSRAKSYKPRRCIDRRFSGPKHMRTRDYGSEEDDDEHELFGL